MADKDAKIAGGGKKDVNVVAENQNWRSYIANELGCA